MRPSDAHRRLSDALPITTPGIREAFAAIPREAFVSGFYQEKGRSWEWCQREQFSTEDWLEQVYQDRSLVTKLDEIKRPMCSSSMPSVMAEMLEALDVQSGQRVVEIGTGTGYNAALLSHLTGDPSLVMTTEIDEEIATKAKQALAGLGMSAIQVLPADAPLRSYDRIIATASAPGIPRTWLSALSTDGRLVMPLQGSLGAGALLCLSKMTGRGLFPSPLSFMPLRSDRIEPKARELFALPVTGDIRIEEDDPLLARLEDNDFRWFLQWSYSGSLQINRLFGSDGRQGLLLKDVPQRSILQLMKQEKTWIGQQHGDVQIWQEIVDHSRRYQEQGNPQRASFSVRVREHRADLCIGEEICLRDLFI